MKFLPFPIARLVGLFQLVSGRRLGMATVCLVCGLSLAVSAQAAEDPRFEEARVHFQRGRIPEALELYDKLGEAGLEPGRVAIGKSRCLEFRGEWKEATEVLEQAASADDDPALLARLAEIYLAQGRFDVAEQRLKRALELDATLPAVKLIEADLLAAQGKLQQANTAYHWFVRYYNQEQPEDSETLILVARGASQYARWNSVPQIFDFVVNTLCTDAQAKDANCWQARLISGMLLLEKFNRAQAIPELKQALAINPHAAEIHAALALAALQDRNLAEAGSHLQRALERNPKHPFVLRLAADIALADGRLDVARQTLVQALDINSRDQTVLGRLAACHVLEDGIPTDAELDQLFAHLEDIDNLPEKSLSRFGTLLAGTAKWNPHPGPFLAAAAEQFLGRSKFEIAERCYRQAVLSMPQLAGPKAELGLLYMRTGNIAEAQKLLDQAYAADPYHVRVSNMRKVLKVLSGYEVITTEHFVIRVDSQVDRVLGKYMAEYLESIYPVLVEQFGFEPPEKTQFEIYNKGKGQSAHQWFSARMVGLPWIQTIGASTGRIVAMASPTGVERPFNWARVVKHEFVHILTLQQTAFNIPHWYTEALAVMSEGGSRPEEFRRVLIERFGRGELMNLDTINLGFARPKTPDDWTLAYCQAQLYAEYMIEKFGPSKPKELLMAYCDNQSTEQAIPRVFGVSKAVFEQGYRDYVETIISQIRKQKIELSLTPGAAEKEHQAHPDDPAVAARFARELLKIGKRKEARKIAQAALEANPGEPVANTVLALLELRAENAPAAIDWLKKGLNSADPHPGV
ncbi:MAG: tetratricopeptide repeat protein, partial [Planctomycetes bacterium]|nr:tetratricopeptide repeat protein [Planctomycetota bacterium]